jgi:hypothetical protein
MKGLAKSTPYFSAYPLKVITDHTANEPNLEPYLKALLASKTKTVSRVKVFPMVNPYPATENQPLIPEHHSKKPNNVEPAGREWFGNYE